MQQRANTSDPALPSGSRASTEPQDASPPSASIPIAGTQFVVTYPFVRETFERWGDGMEGVETPTWRPGIRFEECGAEDREAVADAIGRMTLTVVETFKPGKYPRRVFYTRRFETPDGHMFGKGGLRIKTLEAFRRIAKGYHHEFRLADAPAGESRPSKLSESKKMFAEALGVSIDRLDLAIAQGIEAQRAETHSGSVVDESATPQGDAPKSSEG